SPAPCGSTAGTAHGCRPKRLRRLSDAFVKSGPTPNSRSHCATAGTARTTRRSASGSPPMAKPGLITFWSSLPNVRLMTGYVRSNGWRVPRREFSHEIGYDPEVLADCRGRYGPRMGGRTTRLRRGVVRRGVRYRRGDPGRLGAGADRENQGRHQHYADPGAHTRLRGDDSDDLAGNVGQSFPMRRRAVGASGR